MDTTCWYCGKSLAVPLRLVGMHPRCIREYRRATKHFEAELERVVEGPGFTSGADASLGNLVKSARIQIADQCRAGQQVYARALTKALAACYVSHATREALRELQGALALGNAQTRTPEIDRLRMLSHIVEGNLPVVTTAVSLHKGETAHLEMAARLCHLVERRKQGQTWHELRTLDSGRVLVTSQRLLFIGGEKNVNVKLDNILHLEMTTAPSGVRVHRGTQNPDIFVVGDPELLATVLHSARKAFSS
jgi:hypothetical protein